MKQFVKKLPDPWGERLLLTYRACFWKIERPTFSGWGMVTHTLTPWDNGADALNQYLVDLHAEFQGKVRSGDFVLSQFASIPDVPHYLNQFVWREYFVIASVSLACRSQEENESLSLVEGGVCDGYSSWFAMRMAITKASNLEFWAYDSWDEMRTDELLPSEIDHVGSYGYLDLEHTRRNLKEFGDAVRYCAGYIPESLQEFDGPMRVHWMHIDINAAKPSEDMLMHFWDRMPKGGVVLLDDYNHPGYQETKFLADAFLAKRGQWVLALPTGQGLIIKG